MKIQVVARQVCEDRGVEVEAVNPAERQGVRRHLHRRVRSAGALQLPGKRVDVVELMDWAEAIGFDARDAIKTLARIRK